MENQDTRKNFNWGMLIACLALIVGAVALVLNWQTRVENQKNLAALSVLQLRAAVLSSRPYDAELRYLADISRGDAGLHGALAKLAPLDLTGLPSLQSLDEQFHKAAAAALLAEQSRPSLGVLDSVTSRIAATAVAIGMEAGSNPFESTLTPVISSAEGFLLAGQVTQAVEAINGIPAEFAPHFEDWKSAAESRIAAQAALDELVRKLISDPGPAK